MKLLITLATLVLTLSASAQTSSRFRNEVTNNVTNHHNRIVEACTATANRQYHAQPAVRLTTPSTWLYLYEVKFLNDCFFGAKMQLMNSHIQLLQTRINRLRAQARDRRDANLARDVAGLEQGLSAFRTRQNQERTQFQTEDYGWMGQEDITKILKREIRNVLVEFYEGRAEMRFEGTL